MYLCIKHGGVKFSWVHVTGKIIHTPPKMYVLYMFVLLYCFSIFYFLQRIATLKKTLVAFVKNLLLIQILSFFTDMDYLNNCSLKQFISLSLFRWDISTWTNRGNKHSKVCLFKCLGNSPQATHSSSQAFEIKTPVWKRSTLNYTWVEPMCFSALMWGSTCFVGRTSVS